MAKKGSKRSEAKAAKAQREYWYNVYFKVLKAHDVDVKQVKRITKASVESLKKKYTKLAKSEGLEGIRQEYRKEVAKEQREADWRTQERTEDYRTTQTPIIDVDRTVIDDFIYLIETIYEDTLRYIESRSDKCSDIAYNNRDKIIPVITEYKEKIITLVNEMEEAMNDPYRVATLIKDNVDLDYVVAISLQPPSDIFTEHFEITYQQLKAVWDKVVSEAREEAEREMGY